MLLQSRIQKDLQERSTQDAIEQASAAVKLDLTKPTIVVTGAWNPAIFQPGWCAEQLFDVPAGQQVRTAGVLTGPPPKEITYFDQIGISVAQDRLELFVNNLEEVSITNLENTANRILQRLPHTPVGALGVNFLYVEEEPDDELIDSFNLADSLRQHYAIQSCEIKTAIEVDNHVLNLVRGLQGGTVNFNFNYHFNSVRALDLPEAMIGLVNAMRNHALSLLDSVFSIAGDVEVVGHTFPTGDGTD